MLDSADTILLSLFNVLVPALIILAGTGVYSYIIIRRHSKIIKRLYQMNFNSLETERKRIANDIHDILGNKMIQINKAISNAEQHSDGKAQSEIRSIKSHFSLFHSEVQRSVESLYPRDLIDGELESSLRKLASELSTDKLLITVDFHTDNLPSIDHRLHVFRLVQEKLSNIFKHSGCNKVHIDVADEDGKYFVALIYKGNYPTLGWKKNWLRKTNGRGLHIIRDRLNILKATNNISQCDGNIIDEISFDYENTTT
jgi:signal transduction histidine kinase